jgi:transposase
LNLLLSHLSEQQRGWVAAYESERLGWGGGTLVSLIPGLSRRRILRGQRELDAELQGRPSGRARVPEGGRHPQLTEDELRLLRDLLSQGASAHSWQNNLWTAKRVAELIRKRLGEDLCIHSVRAVLKERLHWTLQKPQIQLKERDEDEITRWKREEFARIRSEARNRRAYIVFIDESGFMLNPTRRNRINPQAGIQALLDVNPTFELDDPPRELVASVVEMLMSLRPENPTPPR